MSRLQSERALNFDEFTDLMHSLLKSAWGRDWGTFCEAFPNGREPKDVQLPAITYTLARKVPAAFGASKEIKPRFRQDVRPPKTVDGEAEIVSIYSQTFDCWVSFDVWSENNTKAAEIADRFEDFMMTYAGWFMSQGVGQILFEEMTTDNETERWRENLVCRKFVYRVRLEKHLEVPQHVIKEVIGNVSVSKRLSDDQDQSIEAINFLSK